MKRILLLGALVTLFISPFAASAQEEQWTLLEKVREAQEKLEAHKIPKTKLQKGEDRVALAALDRESGNLDIINISLVGKTVKVLGKDGWQVKLSRNNGVNSEFRVVSPANKLVVAIKYPVILRKMGKKGEIRVPADAVYSPYSQDLELPEVVANGQAYVDNLFSAVFDKLNALGVKSRVFPEKLLTEVHDRRVMESLLLIEHINVSSIENDLDGALRRLYTTLGLNTIKTFNYSRSRAGARGLAQFIPATYASVRRKWPELSLKSYFEDGMTDHQNAILAQIALMDLHLNALPPEIKVRAFDDPVKTGEYLAASYNGGVMRIVYAIRAWGEEWHLPHNSDLSHANAHHNAVHAKINSLKSKIAKAATAAEAKKLKAELSAAQREHDADWAQILAMRKGTLKPETVGYLKKLRPVYAHLRARQNLINEFDLAARQIFPVENPNQNLIPEITPEITPAPIVTRRVKFETDPKVYSLGADGMLRWVTSESLAAAYYGHDWSKDIEVLSDAFFAMYKFGNPLYSMEDFAKITGAELVLNQ